MNFFTFFLIATSFLLVRCDSSLNKEDSSSNQERDNRFQACYYEENRAQKKSDSVLISIFGQTYFSDFIRLDRSASSMNCLVDSSIQLVPFGDSSCCLPNSYELVYEIIQHEESVFSFQMTAGNDMKFEPISTIVGDQFGGYAHLLSGKYTVNYSKACEIASKNGASLDESVIELIFDEEGSLDDPSSFHWETELEFDHNSVLLLLIDPITGETSKEVVMIEMIE